MEVNLVLRRWPSLAEQNPINGLAQQRVKCSWKRVETSSTKWE
ncbi:Tify domain-containing protein [Psidium guajava]|nr:Tify domain-containing protein [Psidium guajava]